MASDDDSREGVISSGRTEDVKLEVQPLKQVQDELGDMAQKCHELEERMSQIEVSMKEAIETVEARMEDLVKQLGRHLLPENSSVIRSNPPPSDHQSATAVQHSFSAFSFNPSSSTSIANRPLGTFSQSPSELSSSIPGIHHPSSPPLSPTAPQSDRRVVLGRMLVQAVAKGCAGGVRMLLHSGADVNFPISGGTPLHWAADCGQATILSLLLDRGADASMETPIGCTALHFAAGRDRSGRCVSSLVAAGADVHCTDHDSNTPLHWAVRWGNEAAARQLLTAGANKTAQNHDGRTPLFYAAGDEIRQLLQP